MANQIQFGWLAAFFLVIWGCNDSGATTSKNDSESPANDVILYSLVEDVQTLSFALRFVDPATDNGKALYEILGGMLGSKMTDLAQFLPTTESETLISTACDAMKGVTGDLAAVTNSCAETDLCEKSLEVAKFCASKGYAIPEDIALPE